MDLQLTGKEALITGGSRGIGYACAEALAAEGCALHLAARDETVLRQARKRLESKFGVQVTVHAVDLSRGDEARSLAASCPNIDILINNAGSIPRGDLWQIEEDRWREAWNLKVFGYINLCRAAYQQMRSRGKGVIVNIIGTAGERPRLDYITGGMGNAALMALSRALGGRSMKDGIRVVGVNPGLIKTARMEKQLRTAALRKYNDPERWTELIPTNPPPGEPDDVAQLVAFLVSDRARHISGTVITVDGGAASI